VYIVSVLLGFIGVIKYYEYKKQIR